MRNIAKIAAVAGVALSLAACGGQESANNTTDANTTVTEESMAPVEGTTNDTMSMDATNNMSGGMANDTMTTNSTTGGNLTGGNTTTGNMSDMSTNTTTTNTTGTTNAM